MREFQYKSYLGSLSSEEKIIRGSFKNVDILKLPNNFFIGPRLISNVAYPNKCVGQDGLVSFCKDKLSMTNLENYSIKFVKMLKKIKKATGPIFVYSNFKEYGGIKSFIKVLEYHGWKDYKKYDKGHKRYAIWSGDEPHFMKEEIKEFIIYMKIKMVLNYKLF